MILSITRLFIEFARAYYDFFQFFLILHQWQLSATIESHTSTHNWPFLNCHIFQRQKICSSVRNMHRCVSSSKSHFMLYKANWRLFMMSETSPYKGMGRVINNYPPWTFPGYRVSHSQRTFYQNLIKPSQPSKLILF